jgi:hypothetical protein
MTGRSLGRVAATALAVALGALVVPGPGFAKVVVVPTTVHVQSAPLPKNSSGSPQAELTGIWCNSFSHCVAVGRYEARSGGQALLLTKSTIWRATGAAFLPPDALRVADARFTAVDCPSVNNCVAVGQYNSHNGYQGFIETEKNGHWLRGVRAPLPPDAVTATDATFSNTSLFGVSCITITTCVAVGQYVNATGNEPLIAFEHAGVWNHAIEGPMPNYSKPKFTNQLSAISCWSWGNCVAVGQFTNQSPAQLALIDTEVDGIWGSPVAATLPDDADRDPWAWLEGVHCLSAANCVAVGVYNGTLDGQGLIVNKVAGVWGKGLVAPRPKGFTSPSNGTQLLGVHCTALGSCLAVGQETVSPIIDFGVTVTEKKGGWGNPKITPSPKDVKIPIYTAMTAVSCGYAYCAMVGQYRSATGQPAVIVTAIH